MKHHVECSPLPQMIRFCCFQYKSTGRSNHIVSVFQRRVKPCRRPRTPCRSCPWRAAVRSPPQTLQQKPQTPPPFLLLTTEDSPKYIHTRLVQQERRRTHLLLTGDCHTGSETLKRTRRVCATEAVFLSFLYVNLSDDIVKCECENCRG